MFTSSDYKPEQTWCTCSYIISGRGHSGFELKLDLQKSADEQKDLFYQKIFFNPIVWVLNNNVLVDVKILR